MRRVCKTLRNDIDSYIQKVCINFEQYNRCLLIQRKKTQKYLMLYYFGQDHNLSMKTLDVRELKDSMYAKPRYICSRCMLPCRTLCEPHVCIRRRGLKEIFLVRLSLPSYA